MGLFETAVQWLELGVHLVPLQPRSKQVVRGYGPHQRRIETVADAHTWFDARGCNLGLVLGRPGAVLRLVCIDFDDQASYTAWRKHTAPALRTRIEQTGRGFHVYLWASSSLQPAGVSGVEFKTRGLVMAAPSVHPSGKIYQVIAGDDIAHYDPRHLPDLLSLSNPPAPSPRSNHFLGNAPVATLPPAALGVVAQLKLRYPVLPIAQQLTELHSNGGHYWRGRCPFHDDRRASFWVDASKNLWGCLATSCSQAGTHDVINLVAAARNISVRDAIRQLATEA